MKEGLVLNLIGGKYKVLDKNTKEEYICEARGKLRHVTLDNKSSFNKNKFSKQKLDKKTIKLSPKVGDNVTFDSIDGTNIIDDIYPRTNELQRPSIANVDQVLLVFAAKEPDFSSNLLDRFIISIEHAGVEPLIIITKIDLLTNDELISLNNKLEYYKNIGYTCCMTSSNDKKGLDEVISLIDNKISVFAGQTGAGKSSIINAIKPESNIKVQEISKSLGRGKHTTRHSELHKINEGYVADTPGFSSLEFQNMTKEELADTYRDFNELASGCKFRGCLHINEPKCAVKEEIKTNIGLKSRYENYLKLIEQIENTRVKY